MLPPSTVRVLIVDRTAGWRQAVRETLSVPGIRIVGEAATPGAALKAAAVFRPDVVLLDPHVASLTGQDLVRELTLRLPGVSVVLFSDQDDDLEAVRALSSGASGYLTKDISKTALVRVIRGCGSGDLAMSRRMAAATLRHFVDAVGVGRAPTSDGRLDLTLREAEILEQLAAGLTDREIADTLHLSTRTVESHVASVLRKLGVPNRTAAARRFLSWPMRHGGTREQRPNARVAVRS